MKIFGQIVRTAVNIATLPAAVVRDAVTLAGTIDNQGRSHITEHLERIKRESGEPEGR